MGGFKQDWAKWGGVGFFFSGGYFVWGDFPKNKKENSNRHKSDAKQDGLYHECEKVHFLPLPGLSHFRRARGELTGRIYTVGGNFSQFCTTSFLSCFKVFLSSVIPFLNCRHCLCVG